MLSSWNILQLSFKTHFPLPLKHADMEIQTVPSAVSFFSKIFSLSESSWSRSTVEIFVVSWIIRKNHFFSSKNKCRQIFSSCPKYLYNSQRNQDGTDKNSCGLSPQLRHGISDTQLTVNSEIFRFEMSKKGAMPTSLIW